MIALLGALALQQGMTVVRLPNPQAESISVQALVKLPKLSDPEKLSIQIAWPAILEGSEEYGPQTLRGYLQQSGKPLVAFAMSDHLLLRVTFPKNQVAAAASMLDSLLRRPLLEAEVLNKALADARSPKPSAWRAALEPVAWKEAKPSRDEVVSVYRRIVRPENVVLAFGGAFDDAGVATILKRFEDWSPKPEKLQVRSWAATSSPLLKSPNSIGTVELSGPELTASDPAFPIHLLAATALGVGSGSAVWKVAREEQAWSYLQEGFLYPTPSGVRVRMIFAHSGEPGVLETIDPFRAGIQEEVKKWTQADRQRALAVIRNWLENGIGNSPIWLLPEGRIVESEDEKLHLAAWWRMKFGSELSSQKLLETLEKITLDDLKSTASAIVDQASARVLIPGG